MGVPKATLDVGGRTLGQVAVDALRGAGVSTCAAVGGDPRWAAGLGLVHVPDPIPFAGPLPAIAVALRWAEALADVLVLLACDHPDLGASDVSALLEGLRRAPGALTAVPVDPDGRRQPFPAAWRTTARRAVEDQVEAGQRRASAAWIPPVCTAVLRADAMVDLDDPASLEAWKHRTNRTAP